MDAGPEASSAGCSARRVVSLFVGQRLRGLATKVKREDLLALKELVEAGTVTPVIDRTYPLIEAPDAIRYLEEGHARRQDRHHRLDEDFITRR